MKTPFTLEELCEILDQTKSVRVWEWSPQVYADYNTVAELMAAEQGGLLSCYVCFVDFEVDYYNIVVDRNFQEVGEDDGTGRLISPYRVC